MRNLLCLFVSALDVVNGGGGRGKEKTNGVIGGIWDDFYMNIPAGTPGLHESDGAFYGIINCPKKLLEKLKLDGSFPNLIFFSKDKSELASVTSISNYKI